MNGLPPPYYHHGGVTLYHGDALAVLASLPDASVDAVVADPPYSSGGMVRGDRLPPPSVKYLSDPAVQRAEFAGDTRDQRAYGYWCALWLAECLRVTKPGGICCLFTDWRQLPTTTDALQAGGWVWRGVVPWDKSEAARPQKGRYRNQCEYVVWGSNGPMADAGACLPGSYRYVVRQADKWHIAGKPTALMVDLLAIVPTGGVVLDPFAGTGTTLVAAQQRGLWAIGVELLEQNCAIAANRLRQQVLPLALDGPGELVDVERLDAQGGGDAAHGGQAGPVPGLLQLEDGRGRDAGGGGQLHLGHVPAAPVVNQLHVDNGPHDHSAPARATSTPLSHETTLADIRMA
jgi:site-specific DNA-methyltransferase (adenine-specific)